MSVSLLAADKKNPASKAYITDVEGQATVFVGEGRIEDSKKREVYAAEGIVLETEKKSNQSLVLSNGTGIYMDEVTHLEVKKFVQEPFTPNRSDLDMEPSISQTGGLISHGYVAICTPKIVAGSRMVYTTPHGEIKLFNNKVAINVGDNATEVIPVEGEFKVELRSGHFEIIKVGDRVIFDGQIITTRKADKKEMDKATENVAIACNARKTVYFDVVKRYESDGVIEILVAYPVTQIKLPTEFTVSPATIK